MKIRSAIAGVLVATTLTFGATGVATAAPVATHPAPSPACVSAFKTLIGEIGHAITLHHQANDLLRLRAWAVAHHHAELVKLIDARLVKVKASMEKLRGEIKAQVVVVKAECLPAAA